MAKGQLVCEIDALGGEMGVLADRSGIQFKMLGKSKGPAMWSPRSQNDKDRYPQYAQERLQEIDNLTLLEGMVEDVVLEEGGIAGVMVGKEHISCKAVVLCSGTFLAGRMYTGTQTTVGGRVGEQAVEHLSGSLRQVGLQTARLKTGTPPRVHKDSIDYTVCEPDGGDSDPVPFSARTTSVSNTIDCYLTATTPETHLLLEGGFDRSPMFTGKITGTGPRYCPSIEDKIYRFADKSSHQIFLEPEGLDTASVYVNGFSTSLPEEVQLAGLRSIPSLEACHVLRYGYAVEYDYFPSHQLTLSLESKYVRGLFFAGQVNGTSGYEEAAAQGLIAGINAASLVQGRDPLILDRSQGYIGVLIDDLVNLTISEPYRMFTSRAEYRLLLRRDNADVRLSGFGYERGLVSSTEWKRVQEKASGFAEAMALLQQHTLHPGSGLDIQQPTKAWQYLKRPEGTIEDIIRVVDTEGALYPLLQNKAIAEQVEIMATYEGYIKRQLQEIELFRKSEDIAIPSSIDYHRIKSLSSEAREKLSMVLPKSLGQASRIAGVSRSDLAVLSIYVR